MVLAQASIGPDTTVARRAWLTLIRYTKGSRFEAPPITVTINVWRNSYVYVYASKIESYGLPTASRPPSPHWRLPSDCSQSCRQVYQSRRSSQALSRATRQTTFSTDLQSADIQGEEPLPGHLASATLIVGSTNEAMDERIDGMRYVQVSQQEDKATTVSRTHER